METAKSIKAAIGFATGRKNFQRVLKTNIYNWMESGLTDKIAVNLNVMVAYDLRYQKTKIIDYTNIPKDLLKLIDNTFFIGKTMIQNEIDLLVRNNVINKSEATDFYLLLNGIAIEWC
jgi:hypothetical protein